MLKSFSRFFASTAPKLNFARASFIGTVGHFEEKTSVNNRKYLQYSIGINRYSKDREPVTEWYKINVFDENQLKRMENIMRIGNKMHVDAYISTDKVVNEDGNTTNYYTSYIQRGFDILHFGKKPETEGEHTE